MQSFSSYEHFRRLGHFKEDILLGMLKVQTHFFQYKGAEINVKQYGTTDFKTQRLSKIQTY